MQGFRAGAADWVAVAFFLAIVYVLARPQSKASELVQLVSDALVAIVRTVTDM